MAQLFVKKGDTVVVLNGKDRGSRGKVLLTMPKENRVLVEGVNRVKKHTKVTTTTRGAQTGGIVTQEAAVHASNVQIICGNCGWQLLCPNCDIPLVYHADEHIVRCHICGHNQPPLHETDEGSPVLFSPQRAMSIS